MSFFYALLLLLFPQSAAGLIQESEVWLMSAPLPSSKVQQDTEPFSLTLPFFLFTCRHQLLPEAFYSLCKKCTVCCVCVWDREYVKKRGIKVCVCLWLKISDRRCFFSAREIAFILMTDEEVKPPGTLISSSVYVCVRERKRVRENRCSHQFPRT